MIKQRKRIAIVGATSLMAEHCARLWVKQSCVELILLGRSIEKLNKIAADLLVRNPNAVVTCATLDFLDPVAIQQWVKGLFLDGAIDIALIAHGTMGLQTEYENDLVACKTALEVNGISPVLFAEALAGQMQKVNQGTLVVIGSVAGDRGRKANYVYGAGKGLVTRYVQGLQHRLAGTLVQVILIKPGPTATPMVAHLAGRAGGFAKVEEVAEGIVKSIEKKKSVVYLPAKWGIIMMIVRHLPKIIFNRINL